MVNCNLGRISHCFRVMAITYRSKSHLWGTPLSHLTPPWVIPDEYVDEPYIAKTRYIAQPVNEDNTMLCSFIWHNTGVWRTDGRKDRHTDGRKCHRLRTALIAARCNTYQFASEFPVRLCRRQSRYDGSNLELVGDYLVFGGLSER